MDEHAVRSETSICPNCERRQRILWRPWGYRFVDHCCRDGLYAHGANIEDKR